MSTLIMMGRAKERAKSLLFEPGDTLSQRVVRSGFWVFTPLSPESRIVEGYYKLVAEMPLCMHALQSLAPYYAALSRGVGPAHLGLTKPDGAAYLQCMDPLTGGGTMMFRIAVEKQEGTVA